MKRLLSAFIVCGLSLSAIAKVPHLELELDSNDYQKLLKKRFRDGNPKHELTPVMDMGKRNLDWIRFINDHRPEGKKISFSSAAHQQAFPIDSPRVSNPTLIKEEFNKIKSENPAWLNAILFEGAAFTENPPVSDEEYLNLGRLVDRNYQRASRWILQEPYLEQYAWEKANDVRGYYYFTQDPGHQQKLAGWAMLSKEDQEKYTKWLLGVCGNSAGGMEKTCKDKLEQDLLVNGNPTKFYGTYFNYGKQKWDGYFHLDVKRPDVEWSPSDPNLMKVAFLEPAEGSEVKGFLTKNIEEEWRFGKWQLQLNFAPSGNIPHIKFVPGATPNVNGLGGNTITMDGNQPLTEYNVQWTIRHEYGHVLGFPDCYVEFYDKSQSAMISYQLDITNLMCSRRGHIQETHYSELKRIYLP